MNFIITEKDSDLYHHGILGMRWGVRRYQNEDGSLTPLGKRRIKSDGSGGDTYDKVHTAVSKDYTRVQNVQNSASSAARSLSSIANRSATSKRNKAKSRMDLSSMTDEELRTTINRLNLERQYKDITTETIGAGKRNLSDMLQTVGDVLAVGASTAAIMVAIHQLKAGVGKD